MSVLTQRRGIALGTSVAVGALVLLPALSAAAAPTPIAAVVQTGGTSIVVDNATSVSGNVAVVDVTATGANSWDATVEYSVTAPAGNPTPWYVNLTIDRAMENAGFYAILGNVTSSSWRPSASAPSSTREAGPSAWFNEDGDVEYSVGGPIADQFVYTPGTAVSNSFDVELERDANGVYSISGAAIGPDGEPQSFDIQSSSPIFQLYTLGGLGTSSSTSQLEQIVNVEFDV